jgi:hypothetical protein
LNSQHQWAPAHAALNVKTSQWSVALHSASHCPTVAGVVLSLKLLWHLVRLRSAKGADAFTLGCARHASARMVTPARVGAPGFLHGTARVAHRSSASSLPGPETAL